MSEEKILQEAGLTLTEARVYLALVNTGSTLVGPIIRKTGLHRSTTYQILQRLQEKGIISSIVKEKKQYFLPANPQCILDRIREKEQELEKIIPQLQGKIRSNQEKQEVTVYSGKKGIRTVLDHMIEELKPNGTYYDFGVSGLFLEVMGSYWHLWQKQKRQFKIKSYVIFNEELKKAKPQLLKAYHGQARFHSSKFNSLTDTIIYNDTIILLIWSGQPPIAVLIKSKENAQSYKNQFHLLWKQAKR